MIQSSLLDHIEIIPVSPARKSDPETSTIAADKDHDLKGRHRIKALLALDDSDGCTDYELAEITGIPQTSIGCRRHELTGKVKGKQVNTAYVEDSGIKRPSPNGSPCIVWRLTERGHQIAAEIREKSRNERA